MTVTNAIKKLAGAGYTVTDNHGCFSAVLPDSPNIIEFCRNGGSEDVTSIRVRSRNDHDDVTTGYYAGIFMDNLSKAIRFAKRP
jgi:hypothetical protein